MIGLLAEVAALLLASLSASVEPWDPRDVDDLGVAERHVAPVLPSELEVPVGAPSLAEQPLRAAVLSVDVGRSFLLLGRDGGWRSVPAPHRNAQAALSPGGTGLAVQWDDAVTVWDLGSGRSVTHPFPDDLVPWDFTRTRWVDDSTLLIDDYRGGWLVDGVTGAARRTPYPTASLWTVDPRGGVVELADPARYVRVHATRVRVVTLSMTRPRLVLEVTDRDGGEVVGSLAVRDHEANFSNWAMRIVAASDEGPVLLWVAVPGRPHVDGWRLIAWDPLTDRLSVVTRTDATPTDDLSFATDLLR